MMIFEQNVTYLAANVELVFEAICRSIPISEFNFILVLLLHVLKKAEYHQLFSDYTMDTIYSWDHYLEKYFGLEFSPEPNI